MSSWENNIDNMKLEGKQDNYSNESETENFESTEECQNEPETSQDYHEGVEYVEDESSSAGNRKSCSLDAICGLAQVKETLLNFFIYPAIFPRFFPESIRSNQILLYGPPGTGKTMLAKAMAAEMNAELVRITSADLLSHWQGQTEKQIRDLFQAIRLNVRPVVLFFDEIDGLCRKRTNSEDDCARRIKTELLTQLDDFASGSDNHQTFIIGATNCPWEIDSGFMRRFHKKIFIPLPDKESRIDIIKRSFEQVVTNLTEAEWAGVGDMSEGYSASDLINVVMSSCCDRLSQMQKSKFWEAKGGFWLPARPDSIVSTKMNFEDIHPDEIGTLSVTFNNIKTAIGNTPKSVSSDEMLKYLDFSSRNRIK